MCSGMERRLAMIRGCPVFWWSHCCTWSLVESVVVGGVREGLSETSIHLLATKEDHRGDRHACLGLGSRTHEFLPALLEFMIPAAGPRLQRNCVWASSWPVRLLSVHPLTLRWFLSFQACRTPSRNEAGVELLMSYFMQLGFVESRFFPPTRQMGILFTW